MQSSSSKLPNSLQSSGAAQIAQANSRERERDYIRKSPFSKHGSNVTYQDGDAAEVRYEQ